VLDDATIKPFRRSDSGGEHGMAFVSDLAKRKGTIKCPRCKAPMNEVLWIAPVQTDPGLIAYECPSCSYVTSILTSPQSSQR
jgi:transposase-like protein